MRKDKKQTARQKQEGVILVFGENPNDIRAIGELIRAIWPDAPHIAERREPPVLIRGASEAKARKNAISIASVVKAEHVERNVLALFAHQDCDAVEPAHVSATRLIENELADIPNAFAVTPAWEIETWWFMWPDAIIAVNGKWRRPQRDGKAVGMITNAKETLRRELRPNKADKPTRDYEESDSPWIAKAILDNNLIDRPTAHSESFSFFKERVERVRDESARKRDKHKKS